MAGECLGWGLEVEAFARGIIVSGCECVDVAGAEAVEVGFAWQEAAEPADGVFDAAFLPGAVRVTEERLDAELFSEAVMSCELGAVIEGDALSEPGWQPAEHLGQRAGGGVGSAVWRAGDEGKAGLTFVRDEDGLPTAGEQHEVGLPNGRGSGGRWRRQVVR